MIGSNNHRITAAAFQLGYRVSETGVITNPAGTPRLPHLAPKNSKCLTVLYASISIRIEGKHCSLKVHQLAAYQKFRDAAFEHRTHVRHLNSDSTDNRPGNIGIGTASENALDRDPETRRQMALRAASITRKLTPEQVVELVTLSRTGVTGKELGVRFGILKSTVSEILSGKLYSELTGIPYARKTRRAA